MSLKRRVSISLSLIVALSQPVFAGGSKSPEEAKAQNPAGPLEPVKLNPDSIKKLLLEGNIGVMLASSQLHQARIRQDEKRSLLLPSLRLGLSVLAGGAVGLVFGTADFVFNFLLPSVWFESARQTSLVKAEESAYLTMKANQYSTALNIYYSTLLDLRLRNFLLRELNDAREMEFLAQEALENGFGSEADLAQAVSQTATTHVELLKVESMLVENLAYIKSSFALPQTQDLILEDVNLPASEIEEMSYQEALDRVYEKAPEATQLVQLEKAAEKGRWAAIFGFIQSFTVSAATMVGSNGQPQNANFSFDQLQGRGTLDLGFHHFPRIALSASEIDIVILRKEELKREMSRVVKVAQEKFSLAKYSNNLAIVAEREETKVYDFQKQAYVEGRINMSELIQTKARLRGAALNRLQAFNSIQVIRNNFHRLDFSDRFGEIEKCHASEIDNEDLVRAVNDGVTIDEICRGNVKKAEKKPNPPGGRSGPRGRA